MFTILTAIIGLWTILAFVLHVNGYVLISLAISIIIIFLLWRGKSIFFFYFAVVIVLFNLLLLIFSLIPIYDKEIDITPFYKQNINKIIIKINDDVDTLDKSNAILKIQNSIDKSLNTTIKLDEISNSEYTLNLNQTEWYNITFISKTRDIQSTVNIYLWDWTILRLLPQSSINLITIKRNDENLLKSKTQIEISNWSIRFNLIRTVFEDDGFNIKTKNWVIAIRWTAWFVNYDNNDNSSVVYSHDHVIELSNNSKEKMLMNWWEIAKITNYSIQLINIDEIFDRVGKDIKQRIDNLDIMDKNDINIYKAELNKYINDNFWWSLQKFKSLNSFSIMKSRLMVMIDKKYKKNLENYQKYQLLIGEWQIYKWVDDTLIDSIITPINENMKQLKLKYLENLWHSNIDATKSFLINKYNQIKEKWNNYDFEKLKKLFNDIDATRYKQILNDFINQVNY